MRVGVVGAGIAGLAVDLSQRKPVRGVGRSQGQRIHRQPFRFLEAAQAQVGQAELAGDLRVDGGGDERLPKRRQRFLEVVAGQVFRTLLVKRSGLGGIARFRSAQIFQLFPEGLHTGRIVGGPMGDHLLDVIVDGFVLPGADQRGAGQHCPQQQRLEEAIHGARTEPDGTFSGTVPGLAGSGGTMAAAAGSP